MTTREPAVLVTDIAAELAIRLGVDYAVADIAASAAKAMGDLTGSVAAEALSEMAARLAAVRLMRGPDDVRTEADAALDVSMRLNGGRPRSRRWYGGAIGKQS